MANRASSDQSEFEKEEWRPVVGWEGLYEVSDLGRVRSLDRVQEFYQGGRLVKRPPVVAFFIVRRSRAHSWRCERWTLKY